jgi:hypothetical protein
MFAGFWTGLHRVGGDAALEPHSLDVRFHRTTDSADACGPLLSRDLAGDRNSSRICRLDQVHEGRAPMWCPGQRKVRAATHFGIDRIYSGQFSTNLLRCRAVALAADRDS